MAVEQLNLPIGIFKTKAHRSECLYTYRRRDATKCCFTNHHCQPMPQINTKLLYLLIGHWQIQIDRNLLSRHYLLRSDWVCLNAASPLNADKLKYAKSLQPRLGDDASGWSLTRVAAISSPLSRSALSRGIGIAAEGESLDVSAA